MPFAWRHTRYARTMRNSASLVVMLAGSLALGACQKADNEPGPGGVSVGEARALDEAAQMIEDQQLPQGGVAPQASTQPPPASPAPARK